MSASDRKERLREALQRAERAERQEREMRSRLAAWEDRFRALVGEDRPDTAGNAVITLQSRLAAAEAARERAEANARTFAAAADSEKRGQKIALDALRAAESREAALREALAKIESHALWKAWPQEAKDEVRSALASPRTTPPPTEDRHEG